MSWGNVRTTYNLRSIVYDQTCLGWLAAMYRDGVGMPVDLEQMARCYRKAGEQVSTQLPSYTILLVYGLLHCCRTLPAACCLVHGTRCVLHVVHALWIDSTLTGCCWWHTSAKS